MYFSLIGSTGFTGRPILEEMLARGHAVRLIVRRADALVAQPRIDSVIADVNDTPELTKAVAGTDAVVSAFNPGWDAPSLYEQFMQGSRSIYAATVNAGVRRLLVVGGASSLYGDDGKQLIEHMQVPPPYDQGVRAARDYHAELLAETEVDWVFLSPPPGYGPTGPSTKRGAYRRGTETPVTDDDGQSTISPADLATAVVDELEEPRTHRARFTIGY